MSKLLWPKDEDGNKKQKKEVNNYSELVDELEKDPRSVVEREFDTTKAVVREVLKKNPESDTGVEARNSDKFLIWYIRHKVEGHDLNDFSEFVEASSPETIRRVRQEIQNSEGEFLPTSKEVLERRNFREDEIRDYFSESKAEEILS